MRGSGVPRMTLEIQDGKTGNGTEWLKEIKSIFHGQISFASRWMYARFEKKKKMFRTPFFSFSSYSTLFSRFPSVSLYSFSLSLPLSLSLCLPLCGCLSDCKMRFYFLTISVFVFRFLSLSNSISLSLCLSIYLSVALCV